MGYTVKVNFPVNNYIEVSADKLDELVVLINRMTQKFFPNSHAIDIELVP